MGVELRDPVGAEGVLVFVETTLPEGIDAIRTGGIQYVSEVIAVDDLPEWADAARLGSRAFVRKAT